MERLTAGWLASLQLTATDLVKGALGQEGATLIWIGMVPVWPGSTRLVQSPAIVQPQCGTTLLISRVWVPILVKMNVYLAGALAVTLPRLGVVVAN